MIFCCFIPQPTYVTVTRVIAVTCSSPPDPCPQVRSQLLGLSEGPQNPAVLQRARPLIPPGSAQKCSGADRQNPCHHVSYSPTCRATALFFNVFEASRKTAQAGNIPGNPGGCSQALSPCKTKCYLSRFGQIFRKHGSETASAKNRT